MRAYGWKGAALAALTAAALLAGCGRMDDSSSSGSSSMSSSASSASSGAGSVGGAGSAGAEDWKAGLALIADAEPAGDKGGEVSTIAAAVLLDGEGRIRRVVLDELEAAVAPAEDGSLTLPEDLRSKRQKGDEDYPLDKVSSIGKGWAEQADALAGHLVGMTADEVARLATDEEGYAADPDLLAGCTIKVDRYCDAVAEACRQADR